VTTFRVRTRSCDRRWFVVREKTFDVVAAKARWEKAIHEGTKGLSLEQEIEYWRCGNEELRRRRRGTQAQGN
jgi:hypothetical protein